MWKKNEKDTFRFCYVCLKILTNILDILEYEKMNLTFRFWWLNHVETDN